MKKIYGIVLILMCFYLTGCGVKTVNYDGFSLYLSDDKQTYYVDCYNGEDEEITIPSEYNGKKIDKLAGIPLRSPPFTKHFGVSSHVRKISISSNIVDIPIHLGLPNVETIHVDDANPNYASDEGVLYTKEYTELLFYPEKKASEEYIVHKNTTKINCITFLNNTYIKKIVIQSATPPERLLPVYFGLITSADIYVPADAVELYKTTWFESANQIKPILES